MWNETIDIDDILELADGGDTVRVRDLLHIIDNEDLKDYLEDHGYIVDEEKYNVDEAIDFLEENGYTVTKPYRAPSLTDVLNARCRDLILNKPMEGKNLMCDIFGLAHHATAEEVAEAMKTILNWK